MTLKVERAPWTPPAMDEEIIYPDSDGMGIADGDPQRELMFEVAKVLQRRYEADPNVYVTGDIFVYYVEGDPNADFSPDVMVVKGVPKRQRDNYKLWEEGDHVPNFILEIAARSTYKKDLHEKKGLYRLLGVQEYLLFDHTGGEYFQPPAARLPPGRELVRAHWERHGRTERSAGRRISDRRRPAATVRCRHRQVSSPTRRSPSGGRNPRRRTGSGSGTLAGSIGPATWQRFIPSRAASNSSRIERNTDRI